MFLKYYFQLLEPYEHGSLSKKFNTTSQLREVYGERFDVVVKNMQKLSTIIERLWKIYDRNSYKATLSGNLRRMDTILALIQQVGIILLWPSIYRCPILLNQRFDFVVPRFYLKMHCKFTDKCKNICVCMCRTQGDVWIRKWTYEWLPHNLL